VKQRIAAEQRAIITHSDSCGLDSQFFQASVEAKEKLPSKIKFLSLLPELENLLNAFPQLSLWATIVRHSVAEMAATYFKISHSAASLRLCVKT
jgi:hypothetical protein